MSEQTVKDKHAAFTENHHPNHFGDDYWYKKVEGGFTECCEYGIECEKHKAIRDAKQSNL